MAVALENAVKSASWQAAFQWNTRALRAVLYTAYLKGSMRYSVRQITCTVNVVLFAGSPRMDDLLHLHLQHNTAEYTVWDNVSYNQGYYT